MILFIAFAAEELETQGSHHFLTNWLNQGGPIDFAINNDVVGGHAGIEPIVRVSLRDLIHLPHGSLPATFPT